MSAGKYKVGDKVLIRDDLVDNKYYDNLYFNESMKKYAGKVLTIKSSGTHSYEVTNDFGILKWVFNDEMIVGKVEENMEFTKTDLKTGMILTDRTGKKRMVVRDYEWEDISGTNFREDVILYDGGWDYLSVLDDKLLYNGNTDGDIMKVSKLPPGRAIGFVRNECPKECEKVIWRRDEKLELAKQLLSEFYNKPVDDIVIGFK